MAIIKCIECGNEISSFSEICPKCGCPTKITTFMNGFGMLNEPEIQYVHGKDDFSGQDVTFDKAIYVGDICLADDFVDNHINNVASYCNCYCGECFEDDFDKNIFVPQTRYFTLQILLNMNVGEFGLLVKIIADANDSDEYDETYIWKEEGFFDKGFLHDLNYYVLNCEKDIFDNYFRKIPNHIKIVFNGVKEEAVLISSLNLHYDENEIYLFDEYKVNHMDDFDSNCEPFDSRSRERINIYVTSSQKMVIGIENIHIQFKESIDCSDDMICCLISSFAIIDIQTQKRLRESLDILFKMFPYTD